MSKYQGWLIEHIQANPDFIRPERYRNEVLGFLRDPLEDLCISRPKSRLEWGIPLPFDSNYVTYVWFDALINYLTGLITPMGSGTGAFGRLPAPDRQRYPQAPRHLLAHDAQSAGVPLYRHLNVHGYWVVSDRRCPKPGEISSSPGFER